MRNTYQGLHAAHYDLIYAHKPYGAEAEFVHGLLERAGAPPGRLLDVACGTGRHAAEFSRLGWEVTGVDYSPDLLQHARRRTDTIEWHEQDMRELSVPGAPFDAVTCLFDSIGYPQSDDGIVAALTGACEHVVAGGPVAIEFLHAPALTSGASPVRVRRWHSDDGTELVRVSETELDGPVMRVSYDLIELRPDGTWSRAAETQSNRSFEVDEFRGLLERAGFEDARFVPAYESGEITSDTFHVIAVARRPAG